MAEKGSRFLKEKYKNRIKTRKNQNFPSYACISGNFFVPLQAKCLGREDLLETNEKS